MAVDKRLYADMDESGGLMKILEQASLRFMEELQKLYFEDRDIDRLISMADDQISWIGVSDQCGRGKKRTLRALLREQARYPDGFVIVEFSYEADMLTEDICALQGRVYVREKEAPPAFSDILLRVSATVRETSAGLRLSQLHLSSPVPEDRERLFPRLLTQESTEPLRKLLTEKSNELAEKDASLDTLMNNIPGGVIQCDDSPQMNLLQYSDGFSGLFGYTREEILHKFQNQYYRLVYPEDLQPTREAVREQMKRGRESEVEYRAVRKDGSLIWILDRGQLVTGQDGKKTFYAILTDITRTRNAQEALRLSLERHQIIMDQTADIIFEWDIENDSVSCSANWKKKFGYDPVTTGREFRSLRHIHSDDSYVFQGMIRKIVAGIPYCEAEFRVEVREARYCWYRTRVSLQLGSGGCPIKAVGVIIDIDREKREAQKLLERAERDTLTGLYNKGAVQTMIEEYMDLRMGECALMIIDVDNFKRVNDQLGHLSGDVLLSDVAQALQKQFRSMDILGRIGGDEFIVLMRNIPDEEIIARKAGALLEAFSNLADPACPVSCSIGIALGPRDGADYHTLFRNADLALYQAKTKGKNTFSFYSSREIPFIGLNADGRVQENTRIDSEREEGAVNNRLVEYIFHTLYASGNTELAIPHILEIIGKQYDVSRSCVFEESDDGCYITNTFEWCAPEISSKKDASRIARYSDNGDYYENFDQNGIFYCRDVRQLGLYHRELAEKQGIKSMLQCAICDNGVQKGFIGFDECRNHRLWNSEQIETLSFIAEVVSVFLLKNRAQHKMSLVLSGMRLMLDNQEDLIYVIGQENYRLLYVNRKTKGLVPGCVEGLSCHHSFFRRETPCEECPLGRMRKGEQGKLSGFTFPNFAGHLTLSITEISWPEAGEAYLLIGREHETP